MIFLICGKQGSGKSTLAKNLVEKLNNAVLMKFADPIYDMHEAIYDVLAKYNIFKGPEIDGQLLQVLGTEWGRRKDPHFWVKVAQQRVKNIYQETANLTTIPLHIVIDDCRFENELNAFDSLMPTMKILLHAEEPARKLRAAKWRENVNHESEIGLDHISLEQYDLVLKTDYETKEDTLQAVLRKISV